ncbi:MAG: hypothetical protein ACRDRN_03195 [Sciscionella sp.]
MDHEARAGRTDGAAAHEFAVDLLAGDHIRLLGVRRDEDPESGVLVAEIMTNSESFVLETGYR